MPQSWKDVVTEAACERFNGYRLRVIADSEKRIDKIDAHIHAIIVQAAAANIRLCDIEDQIGQFHDAFAMHLLAKTSLR
jgi:hypothetical protein